MSKLDWHLHTPHDWVAGPKYKEAGSNTFVFRWECSKCGESVIARCKPNPFQEFQNKSCGEILLESVHLS